MHPLRVIAAGFRFHLKSTLRSGAQVAFLVVVPVVYATLGFYVFRSGGNRESLLWIALGAGIMGIWSTTLVGSGMALQRERWAGTLEVLISAPPRFVYVLTGVTLATASIGVYSLAASLAWGVLIFDVPLGLEHPLAFAVAVPVTVVSLGLFGLVLAATFVLYRQTFALTNLLEYPVWLFAGLLVPLALLPAWLQPVAWFIAPTWGVRAIREATLGGSPWPELGVGRALPMTRGIEAAREVAAGAGLSDVAGLLGAELAIGLAYGAVAYLLLPVFEAEGRRRASLETF